MALEQGFGTSLDDIEVKTGSEPSRERAAAVARGQEVTLDPSGAGDELLLAHELAHVVAGREGRSGPEGAGEGDASRAAFDAVSRSHGHSAPPGVQSLGGTSAGGLGLRRCGGDRVREALDGTRAWTPEIARDALDRYRGYSSADRERTVSRYFSTGRLEQMMRTLPREEVSTTYNDVVQDILRRAQRSAAGSLAQSLGLADRGAMVQAQTDFMVEANRRRAVAARPVSAPPPTTAEVAAQQQARVSDAAPPRQTTGMQPAEISEWTRRATAARSRVVDFARRNHPALGLTEAQIHVDVVAIHNYAQNVIAYEDFVGGNAVAVVGRRFAEMVEADPAYALDVVIHELHGHREYGPYATSGGAMGPGMYSEFGLEIYDAAAARMPGYTRPADDPGRNDDARDQEVLAYGYPETEIYSLLRQSEFNRPLRPEHSALTSHAEPEQWVTSWVGHIKNEFEGRVARAMLRGMYVRFRADPRLTAGAVDIFRRAVRANYQGAEATAANEILL